MPISIRDCTRGDAFRRADAWILCGCCLTVHAVDWQPGWDDRLDTFVGAHYEEHGFFQFTFHVR
jgi:hypothetical protein